MTPARGLGCDLLLRRLLLRFGCWHCDRSILALLRLCLVRWWRSEDGLGFREEVELAFARDADVSGESNANGEAGELIV